MQRKGDHGNHSCSPLHRFSKFYFKKTKLSEWRVNGNYRKQKIKSITRRNKVKEKKKELQKERHTIAHQSINHTLSLTNQSITHHRSPINQSINESINQLRLEEAQKLIDCQSQVQLDRYQKIDGLSKSSTNWADIKRLMDCQVKHYLDRYHRDC